MEPALDLKPYHEFIIEFTRTTCTENRIGIIRLLLGNLTLKGVKDVHNISAKMKKRRKYSLEPTTEQLAEDEDAWFELNEMNDLIRWAGCANDVQIVGFIKMLLKNYRSSEIRSICSTQTFVAREVFVNPERVVSRPLSVPARWGWWSPYRPEDIVAVDCEMIAKIVGRKNNGRPRCKQIAGTVSVANYNYEIMYKKTIKHDPKDVYLTPEARRKTGFSNYSFVNGTELSTVKSELHQIFKGKLLIFVNAGSDFAALDDMERGAYDVFDLHTHYKKDTGNIGLRSLVHHFYHIDIQAGVHDPDTDAKYTMKIFREKYITDKLQHPAESQLRTTDRKFNEIATFS